MQESEPLLPVGPAPELLDAPKAPEPQAPGLIEVPESVTAAVEASAAEQAAANAAAQNVEVISEVPGVVSAPAQSAEAVVSVNPDQVAIAQDRIRKGAELLAAESARAVAAANASANQQVAPESVESTPAN